MTFAATGFASQRDVIFAPKKSISRRLQYEFGEGGLSFLLHKSGWDSFFMTLPLGLKCPFCNELLHMSRWSYQWISKDVWSRFLEPNNVGQRSSSSVLQRDFVIRLLAICVIMLLLQSMETSLKAKGVKVEKYLYAGVPSHESMENRATVKEALFAAYDQHLRAKERGSFKKLRATKWMEASCRGQPANG